MIRRLGKTFFFVLIAVTLFLPFLYLSGSWTWLFTIVAAALALVIAFLSFVYFARLRAAEGFFDKANDPTVTFSFTTEGVRTESDLGSTDLRWQVFEEVLKFQDVWLLVYAKSGYMTLPLDQITPECASFIDEHISTPRNGSRNEA